MRIDQNEVLSTAEFFIGAQHRKHNRGNIQRQSGQQVHPKHMMRPQRLEHAVRGQNRLQILPILHGAGIAEKSGPLRKGKESGYFWMVIQCVFVVHLRQRLYLCYEID